MDHPNPKDLNATIEWARNIIANPDMYLVLDSETTGLGQKDIIVQIGIIDPSTNIILDTLIRPTSRKTIPREASSIHGITIDMLEKAPTFVDIYPKFKRIIRNKELVIYNAKFDTQLIVQTAVLEGVKEDFKIDAHCAMLAYSMYIGEWSSYHGNYNYQKLPSGDHTAIGDCKATLDVINKMAITEFIEIPKKWWQLGK
ncbi:MAG: 3'-5' exonuclease [Bacteroidota bacterium]|nr:3'-5' exonuclease [Bacteroidota bacterium]